MESHATHESVITLPYKIGGNAIDDFDNLVLMDAADIEGAVCRINGYPFRNEINFSQGKCN